jgi:uncharacterized protein YjbI with pentapeptide repeats
VQAHPVQAIAAAATLTATALLVIEVLRWAASRPGAGWVLLGVAGLTVLLTSTGLTPLRKRATRASLGALIAAAWAAVAVVVMVLAAGAWWAMGAPAPRFPTELSPRHLDAIATRSFAIVAGLGGAALLVINYRRQRTTEDDATRAELAVQREDTRLFTERFDSATEKLGSEHAAVRLAGVHALAHLADDAPEGRDELVQMCIDVLCAYLRMPYEPPPEELDEEVGSEEHKAYQVEKLTFAGLREVRHTIIRIIGDHLRADTRWRGRDYDFTGVVFDGGNLAGAHFTGGEVSFTDAQFTSAKVSFDWARFTGAKVSFVEARFTGAQVSFDRAKFTGGELSFDRSRFTGGHVTFVGAQFTGAQVSFDRSQFADGKVFLNGARFTHDSVSFANAEFSGGEVNFIDLRIAEGFFGEAHGACPNYLVESIAAGVPGVVSLPAAWRRYGSGDWPDLPPNQ